MEQPADEVEAIAERIIDREDDEGEADGEQDYEEEADGDGGEDDASFDEDSFEDDEFIGEKGNVNHFAYFRACLGRVDFLLERPLIPAGPRPQQSASSATLNASLKCGSIIVYFVPIIPCC